jgi:hypothetical protein
VPDRNAVLKLVTKRLKLVGRQPTGGVWNRSVQAPALARRHQVDLSTEPRQQPLSALRGKSAANRGGSERRTLCVVDVRAECTAARARRGGRHRHAAGNGSPPRFRRLPRWLPIGPRWLTSARGPGCISLGRFARNGRSRDRNRLLTGRVPSRSCGGHSRTRSAKVTLDECLAMHPPRHHGPLHTPANQSGQ